MQIKENYEMKKLLACLLAVLMMTAVLTACTTAGGGAGTTASGETTKAPENGETTGADSHYPVTITTYNYEGEEITTTYTKAPESVLCVYQGCIETMIALGLEDRVVASYGLDNDVKPEWEEALGKMNYNSEVFAPDKETVTMMAPDMIFTWGSLFGEKKLGDVGEWIALGTNTYISTNTRRGGHNRTLENEYTDLLNIGKIFNVEEKAQQLVDEMKAEVAAALAASQEKGSPNTAVIEFMRDSISNYGATSLGGDMVKALGGTLATPDASKIGKEDLVALDPEVIFIVYMPKNATEAETIAKITQDPAFASLQAVKNGRVYAIMLGDMYASTVRSIDGLRVFSAGLYPAG